jgi:endonuclease/exonuclease/phosphatase family metal-dependent hydrolase
MLQVITFNLGGARKLRPAPHDPVQVGRDAAATLRSAIDPTQPTIIGLQEVSHLWRDAAWHSAHHALQAALFASGARYDYAPEVTTHQHPHARLWDRPTYAATSPFYGAEGNALLATILPARWPWPHYSAFGPTQPPASPHDRTLWSICVPIGGAALYSTGTRDTQPRNLMIAALRHSIYGDLYALNTHLGTISGEDRHDPAHPRTVAGIQRRTQQAEQIVQATEELRAAEDENDFPPRPLILMGDFNALPGTAPMQTLQAAGYTLLPVRNPPAQQWTHTGHRILIDHILINDPRRVLPPAQARVQVDLPFDDLTDHRPVIATFAGER